MSKRLLSSLARGLLALSLLGLGVTGNVGHRAPSIHAEEIDCEDKDNFNDPDCVLQRQQNAPPPAGAPPAQAEEAPPAPPEGQEKPPDEPPWPDKTAKKNSPAEIIFQLPDAGKEATQYEWKEGADECGQWAQSRFERDRELGSSRLGPNVIFSKAWVCKDVEAAKKLFKDQAAIKNFPMRARGEIVSGPNEKFKFEKYAEETAATSGYYDGDKWVGRHYLFLHRKGNNIGQLYLFGREDLFDEWIKGLDDWFSRTYAGRL